MSRRDEKQYESFKQVKLRSPNLSSRRRPKFNLSGFRDECLGEIKSKVFKEDVPEILLERTAKALHYLIKWNSQKGKILDWEKRNYVDLFRLIFSHVKYPADKRDGFNPDEHLSTYLYHYISDFPRLFNRLMWTSVIHDQDMMAYHDEILELLKNKEVTAEELLPLLYHKPLRDLFKTPMPLVPIPPEKRFEHTHVLAKTHESHYIPDPMLK